MKCFVLLCLLLGTAYAAPPARTSAWDLMTMLENMVGKEGHELISKVVQVIHKVEDGLISLKNIVPKVYVTVHRDAEQVLAELKELANEVQQLISKNAKSIYFGFDVLSGLTELTGGTKLSTILSVLQLADKANKVVQDAREFVPHLEKELSKIESKIESHVSVLTDHVIKELGLDDIMHGYAKKSGDILDEAKEEAHLLLLSLLAEIQHTFELVKSELPYAYDAVEDRIEEVNHLAHEIIAEFREIFELNYSILDIAGDLTKGTSLGTAIKVMSLMEKFNTVVQDIKGFSPHAAVLIEHSVEKVASHAQQFFMHTAKILAKS